MASRHRTRAYRIVSTRYPPFDGTGSYRWGSRWVSPGRWVVHCAETYSLAVLENLVHWQSGVLPPNLLSVKVEIPPGIDQEEISVGELSASWPEDYTLSRKIGDDWYQRCETAVLRVPSVVSPVESNLLFNQQHADFDQLTVGKPTPVNLDPRLWTAASKGGAG